MKIKLSFFKKNLCKATIPIMLLLIQCDQIPDYIPEYEVAAKWADMTLFITKNTHMFQLLHFTSFDNLKKQYYY